MQAIWSLSRLVIRQPHRRRARKSHERSAWSSRTSGALPVSPSVASLGSLLSLKHTRRCTFSLKTKKSQYCQLSRSPRYRITDSIASCEYEDQMQVWISHCECEWPFATFQVHLLGGTVRPERFSLCPLSLRCQHSIQYPAHTCKDTGITSSFLSFLYALQFGPFRPQIQVTVPFWLALILKKQGRCLIVPPRWLQISSLDSLVSLERTDDIFQAWLVQPPAACFNIPFFADTAFPLRRNRHRLVQVCAGRFAGMGSLIRLSSEDLLITWHVTW